MDLRGIDLVETPSEIVNFDQTTPTTPGVIFDPNTPATEDVLYVSSIDASTWIYNGTSYVTYTVSTSASTPFYLSGTTIDAGGNKTAAIHHVGPLRATTFQGNGASIVGLNATNLAIGTVPTARMGSGTADSSTFLRGDGSWQAPSSPYGIFGIANSSGQYTYYATLTLAIAGAVSGDTIEQFGNVTETTNVSITWKNGVNFNGNGYTYTNSYASGDCDIIKTTTGTNTFTLSNWRLIRSGRANGTATDYVINIGGTQAFIRFNNVYAESTYGNSVKLLCSNAGSTYFGSLYGKGYLTGILVQDATSGNLQGESTTNGKGIHLVGGNSLGYYLQGESVSGEGIYNQGYIRFCTGESTSGSGIYGSGSNNCGISTSGAGLTEGTQYNSTGISTSGTGGASLQGSNNVLISSSSYGWYNFFGNYLMSNSYIESSSSYPIYNRAVQLRNSFVYSKWNNASGHAIYTWNDDGTTILVNNTIKVTHASAYCLRGLTATNVKLGSNVWEGATTPYGNNITVLNSSAPDSLGNILV
jgi:hypothetical protein